MDIKKLFINCMVVLCVVVVIFSVVTVVKRGNEPEDKNEITYDLMENSEIVVGTEFEENTESTETVEEVVSDTKVLYTTSRVNVRTGPATTYSSLGEIPAGTEVSGVGELDEAGWQKIIYDDQEAYILGTYLTDEAPENQAASNGDQTTNSGNNSSTASQSTNTQANPFEGLFAIFGDTSTNTNTGNGAATEGNTVTDPNAGASTEGNTAADPNAGAATEGNTAADPNAGAATEGNTAADPNAGAATEGNTTVDPNAGVGDGASTDGATP